MSKKENLNEEEVKENLENKEDFESKENEEKKEVIEENNKKESINKEENENTNRTDNTNQRKETGFFRKVYNSIVKIEKYPDMAAQGFPKAISYITKLVVILSIGLCLGMV